MLHRQLSLIVVLTLSLAPVAGCATQAATAEECPQLSEELARLEMEMAATQARAHAIEQMNEGIRQYLEHNILDAERAMVEAIKTDPTYADAYLNLGKVYRKKRQWTDAETMFRAAIDNMGDNPSGAYYFELGAVQVAQSLEPGISRAKQHAKWREAIASFSKAVDVEPDLFKAHYQIGALHEKLDEPEQADSAYRKCIEIDPSYSPCFVSLGNMYIDYGFSAVAMTVLETGTHVNDADADMWNGMGRALLNLNRPKEAIEAYQKARQISPDRPDVLFGLGMAYAEIPMRKESLDVLNEFIDKAGDAPEHIIKAAQDTILRMETPF